jgi:hypothetical protein
VKSRKHQLAVFDSCVNVDQHNVSCSGDYAIRSKLPGWHVEVNWYFTSKFLEACRCDIDVER